MRKSLLDDALLGFLSFFTFLSVIQAALNAMSPDPKVWPSVLALILLSLTSLVWWLKRRA